jgi:hypothetical protein
MLPESPPSVAERSELLRSFATEQMSPPLPESDEEFVDESSGALDVASVDALVCSLVADVDADAALETALVKELPPPHAPSATIMTAAVTPTRALFMDPPRLSLLVAHLRMSPAHAVTYVYGPFGPSRKHLRALAR